VRSVRQLANDLKADPRFVRGLALGLGVRLIRTPAADLIAERDCARISKVYHERLRFAS
jgi:hypothetical protein